MKFVESFYAKTIFLYDYDKQTIEPTVRISLNQMKAKQGAYFVSIT